ncbi:MAG: hypothetical protein J0L73_28350 [Verrucomicrobia bacterium]|nr:hypothetical protein [Verrucomicrobiota bacterium]
MNANFFDSLVEQMLRRHDIIENEHKKHETGYVMTSEQAATMSAALRLTKGPDYRPYCLAEGCDLNPRVALFEHGFRCWNCGNTFSFDLQKFPAPQAETAP